MFTGIIENIGTVKNIKETGGDVRLTIYAENLDFSDVALGDSIASNGICLTVVEMDKSSKIYSVDVSRETLNKTAMHLWKNGDTLNLEKAMLPTTRFGGHIVSGHVDCVGEIIVMNKDARSIYIEVKIPSEFKHYMATKGSITVDGISLTTNLVKDDVFCLNIIPHTTEITNIGKHWHIGRLVNIEVDVIARYLERLLLKDNGLTVNTNPYQNKQSNISESFLAENGFL